jgi:VanZ family protein
LRAAASKTIAGLISSAEMLRRASLWIPPLLYMFVIFYLSSESEPLPAVTAHVWDKLLHTIEYTGLAVLVARALAGEGASGVSAILLTVVFVSAYGASDEWHQSFVPLRTADVADWLTDTVAALLGSILYLSTASRLRRPLRR